ncbi:MAG TPA: hypothetical protein VHW02_07720 [Rhizomicrobium sp.]|jgi:hypothetical protein|nr:hypothetical protein [Rhizomicrobium sp.]
MTGAHDHWPKARWCRTAPANSDGDIGISFETADGALHRFRFSADESIQIRESITIARAGKNTFRTGMQEFC